MNRLIYTAVYRKKQIVSLLLLFVFSLFIFASVQAREISPFPENIAQMETFRDHIGTSYYFYITGKEGSLWGTGTYTIDSDVAAAAVHMGLLAIDQTGIIKVTVLPGQENYTASTANGLSSSSYGSWSGSYTLQADDGGNNPVLPDPGSLTSFRSVIGGVYQFNVTGSLEGSLWGSNVYTDDSSLAIVSVHAGLLSAGQSAVIRVIISPGLSFYVANTANGITSSAYNSEWDGSFSVSNIQGTGVLMAWPGSIENPLSDPGNLTSWRDFTGGAYYFTLTGDNTRTIWGSSFYTDDSHLSTAAVHAGVLNNGQSGIVKATIEPGQKGYFSSTSNGVTSSEFNTSWSGSYSLSVADGQSGSIPVINSSLEQSLNIGEALNYQISATHNPSYYQATGLPESLSVSASGRITGTGKISGRYPIELLVSNSSGTSTKTLILLVGEVTNDINNACVSGLSSTLVLDIPILQYDTPFGYPVYFWVKAQYLPKEAGLVFEITAAGEVTDEQLINANCNKALLTGTDIYRVSIPRIDYSTAFSSISLSADFILEFSADNKLYLRLTGYDIFD